MSQDWAAVATANEESAATMVQALLDQLAAARATVEENERRAVGLRQMIGGLVEMFPALEDLLPSDLDGDEVERPRGAAAVIRVLGDQPPLRWFSVIEVVRMLHDRDWLPESSNPGNAVRTALERAVESGEITKGRAEGGQVMYRYGSTPTEPAYDEEPF